MAHVNFDDPTQQPLPVQDRQALEEAGAPGFKRKKHVNFDDPNRFQTFSEQRGALRMPAETALERGDVPDWLDFIQKNIIEPAGGVATAAPLLPIAGITGVGAGALPVTAPLAFSAGTKATEQAMRGINRALGYRVPPQAPVAAQAVEVGANALAYPIGEALPGAVKATTKRVLGLTAREKSLTAAAEDMQGKLNRLPDLHDRVRTIADTVEGRVPAKLSAAEKQAQRLGQERAKWSPMGMTSGVGPLATDAERAAMGQDALSAGAQLRDRTVGEVSRLVNQKQAQLGAEYEALHEPFMNVQLTDDLLKPFAERAAEIKQNAAQYESQPGALKGLIDTVASWGEDKEAEIRKEVTAQFEKKYAAQTARASGQSSGPAPASVTQAILSTPAIKAELDAAIAKRVAEEKPKVTFGDLKSMRGDLRRYVNTRNAPAGHAAQDLDRAILDVYGAADLPKDPELNQRYRFWKDVWPWQEVRKLRHATEARDIKAYVTNEKLAPLLDVADAKQAGVVKRLVAQTIRDEKLSPTEIVRRFPAPVLRSMFGPGGDDVAAWAQVQARGSQLADMLATDPSLKQWLVQKQTAETGRLFRDGTRQIKGRVVTWLDALGKPAEQMAKDVRAMSPEQATQFYWNEMSKPEFGQRLIQAAKEGTPIMSKAQRTIRGVGSLPFAGGLAAMELMQHGAITSPYVLSVPLALAAETAFVFTPEIAVRLAESNGMKATMRLLDQAWNPATRKAALSRLGRQMGKIAASDALRAGFGPDEEQ